MSHPLNEHREIIAPFTDIDCPHVETHSDKMLFKLGRPQVIETPCPSSEKTGESKISLLAEDEVPGIEELLSCSFSSIASEGCSPLT